MYNIEKFNTLGINILVMDHHQHAVFPIRNDILISVKTDICLILLTRMSLCRYILHDFPTLPLSFEVFVKLLIYGKAKSLANKFHVANISWKHRCIISLYCLDQIYHHTQETKVMIKEKINNSTCEVDMVNYFLCST